MALDLKDGEGRRVTHAERVEFSKRPANVRQLCKNLIVLLQPRFNRFWAPNAISSHYTFNSCRAGFSVGDVLTVIRWRVEIIDL